MTDNITRILHINERSMQSEEMREIIKDNIKRWVHEIGDTIAPIVPDELAEVPQQEQLQYITTALVHNAFIKEAFRQTATHGDFLVESIEQAVVEYMAATGKPAENDNG